MGQNHRGTSSIVSWGQHIQESTCQQLSCNFLIDFAGPRFLDSEVEDISSQLKLGLGEENSMSCLLKCSFGR